MFGRNPINEVFTPRNPDVNKGMYIERPELEKLLYRSVLGGMHSFLFGESGNGKSWMYKKVLSEKRVNYVVANCANASRKNSITDEIYSVCVKSGKSTKTGYKETKKAGLSAVGKVELSHQGEYVIERQDELLSAFEAHSKKSSGGKSIIVLDNVETIFDNKALMNELSDIIILLDDAEHAKFQVKFLVVGVPSEVLQYFSAVKNPASVGNRIEEIPRITGLSYLQVLDLVERGFKKYLKVDIPDTQKRRLSRHIHDVTLGVPQRIHEYCECLAYELDDNDWIYKQELLDKADEAWLLKGLRECYALIEKHLNSEETLDGRRNQVIYSLGKLATHEIDTGLIGEVIAAEFPNSSPDSNSGIGQVLGFLSKGKNPVIKRITNSNAYTLCDPRYLMCIRLMLYKDPETERVKKIGFKIH